MFTEENKVSVVSSVNSDVKHGSNGIFYSFAEAHLSKVMTWKIWASFKKATGITRPLYISYPTDSTIGA